jgi:hypothetical protein
VQRTGASPPAFCRALLCLLALASLPPLAPAHAAGTGIEHIVIVWLNDPGNRADRERILAESRVLTAIPGVTGLRSGRMIPSPRPVVDSSFDVALIVSLSAREALQAYLTHPVHVQLVEETLKPLVKKILVYDIGP